jgi:S1-C subfamily serine protease
MTGPIRCPECQEITALADDTQSNVIRCARCQSSFTISQGGTIERGSPADGISSKQSVREVKTERHASSKSSGRSMALLAGSGVALCLLTTGLLAIGGWYLLSQEKKWLHSTVPDRQESTDAGNEEPADQPAIHSPETQPAGADGFHADRDVPPRPPAGDARSADTPIPYQRVQDLKDATVYLKVSKGPINGTGSGFVMLTEGDGGYLVTNAHVVNPRAEMVMNVPAQPRPKSPAALPGNRRSLVPRPGQPQNPGPLQTVVRSVTSTAPAKITLVFRSGTRKETSVSGEIVCVDHFDDLAILKFKGPRVPTRPIDFMQTPRPVETMTIYVFGFPFGPALALNNGNPSVTVGKGTVSSVRLDARDQLTGIQIDGAINPGNSGGPVVDSEGRLVGIAARTIRGSGIGMAIPTDKLIRMFNGRIGEFRLATKGPAEKGLLIEAKANVFDPKNRIKEVSIHYLPKAAYKNLVKPTPEGVWSALPEAQSALLALDHQAVSGTFTVPPSQDPELDLIVQSRFTTADGRAFYGEPERQRIANPTAKVDKKPTSPDPPKAGPKAAS